MLRRRITAWSLLGVLCTVAMSGRLGAQETTPQKDPVVDALDARARSFLEAVSQGNTQQAFDDLLRGSPLLLKQAEAIKRLIRQTNELPARFGRYCNFERISARPVGKDLVVMVYLYKCEDFPVVWYLTFYRPPARNGSPAEENAWRVIIVRFDTKLEELAHQR